MQQTHTQEASNPVILTPREVEVAEWLGTGLTNREIGLRLCISTGTVKTHVENMLLKLAFETVQGEPVENRTQIALWCREHHPVGRKQTNAGRTPKGGYILK